MIDALLDYCASPQQFDATQDVPLDRFLATAAWRNVDNLRIGERRRKECERKAGSKKREADVALDPAARNIRREEREECEERQAAILAALDDPKDKEIMTLRLEGVRDTAPYARILNITDPIVLLGYLFLGGSPPPEPFPAPGMDQTDDVLGCKRGM